MTKEECYQIFCCKSKVQLVEASNKIFTMLSDAAEAAYYRGWDDAQQNKEDSKNSSPEAVQRLKAEIATACNVADGGFWQHPALMLRDLINKLRQLSAV